jgi:hypothetical protein
MIAISTIDSNVNGDLVIREIPGGQKRRTARVSRTATLDGGCVITHSGFSYSDYTLSAVAFFSKADEDRIRAVFERETFLRVSTKFGFFSGAIESLTENRGKTRITLLITEKLSL